VGSATLGSLEAKEGVRGGGDDEEDDDADEGEPDNEGVEECEGEAEHVHQPNRRNLTRDFGFASAPPAILRRRRVPSALIDGYGR
jgi:hypothetical protein